MTPSPIVLLFTSAPAAEIQPYVEAARRAGVALQVVTDRIPEARAAGAGDALPASFERRPAHVDALLRSLDGCHVEGVLVVGRRPAWLAAHVAQARRVAWHGPEAVTLCTDRLLTRGRFLAAGLPTPWFVGLSAVGDDAGLLSRVRVPCVIGASDTAALGGIARAGDWDAVVAARDACAFALADGAGQVPDDAMLVIEGEVPGRGFVLDGVLEQGALRVFALFEEVVVASGDPVAAALHVSPARMAPERQHVVAGHVARAALALGLHHGPLHAACRVDEDDIVVLSVAPCPSGGALTRALPVVAPDRTRCAFEDALLAHALGRPLDRYGHQAIASGVLTVDAAGTGRFVALEGRDQVNAMEWVTGVEVAARPGDRLAPGLGNSSRAGHVYAQGAQPDDVVATLGEAARRLRVVMEPDDYDALGV